MSADSTENPSQNSAQDSALDAAQTAEVQRRIQQRVDRQDAQSSAHSDSGAMQAGARRYPANPMPAQHLRKPGEETDLDPAPMYDAPYYKGSGKLEGKVALITGGDSGIGRAVAVLFAREGADVAINYLSEERDAAFTCDAVRAEGRECEAYPGDVSDPEFCRRLVADVVERFGKLDVLVNNAAFQLHIGDLEDLSDQQFDQTIKTNLYGMYYLSKAAAPHLPQGGAIVNTGSVTGLRGSAHLLDYSMTKGGIHAFTRSLAGNLAPRGIRVNAVAPGPVWTPLNPADSPADEIVEFGADTLMKRPAQPEEIAPAYVFLASAHCSSYITGEVLPIIGGYG